VAGKGSTFNAFYVAYGGEPFYLDRYIEQTRQSRRRVLLLDGDGLTDIELVELCEASSEDPRTIVLDNAQELKGNKELRRYVERRNPVDQSVILAAIVRSESLSELWSFVASKGKSLEWKKCKPWDKEAYHTDFISKEATRNGVAIRKRAVELLYQSTGPDLYRLANEIKKLAIYAGSVGEITEAHVAQIATQAPEAEPSLVAEAVMAKDVKRALQLFGAVCAKSGETQYGAVVYQLMKHVENTTVVRSMFDKGMSAADVAGLLGQNLWRFNNAVAPTARKHELRSLVRYMGQLSKLDVDVKSSSPFKRTMIEMVILSMAQ